MVGDFNTLGFYRKRGLSLPNSHYYSKLKGDAIYTSTCLLNLNQCIDNVGSPNLLDLIFSNLSDLRITPVNPGLIKPDNYHPPLIINIYLPFTTSIQNYVYSYRKFSSGDYALLYNILSTFDCLVRIVPPLSILLSPASMLLFKMPWNMQFPMALQTLIRISHIGILIP
jgi:hypothetical protein